MHLRTVANVGKALTHILFAIVRAPPSTVVPVPKVQLEIPTQGATVNAEISGPVNYVLYAPIISTNLMTVDRAPVVIRFIPGVTETVLAVIATTMENHMVTRGTDALALVDISGEARLVGTALRTTTPATTVDLVLQATKITRIATAHARLWTTVTIKELQMATTTPGAHVRVTVSIVVLFVNTAHRTTTRPQDAHSVQ